MASENGERKHHIHSACPILIVDLAIMLTEKIMLKTAGARDC